MRNVVGTYKISSQMLITVIGTMFSLTSAAAIIPISLTDPAEIRLANNVVYYNGNISDASASNLLDMVSNANPAVTRLVINSGGGETDSARKIGRWVHNNNVDVKVIGGCFSSCANYIFPAAKNKVIAEDAFVGWHGAEVQYEVLAQDAGISSRQLLEQDLRQAIIDTGIAEDSEAIEEIIKSEISRFESTSRDEQQFFKEIGVDIELAVHGLRPATIEQLEQSQKNGWTYSISDMAKFGVTNVRYEGSLPYLESETVKQYLEVITVSTGK